MEITKALYKELKCVPEGSYAPQLFRHRGIIECYDAPITTVRANGIRALFASPEPVILKNELIAGNRFCLYSKEDANRIEHANRIVGQMGLRSFGSNSDHFAPNYWRILADGVPGLFAEIDASIAAHADDERRLVTLRAMRTTLEGFAAMIAINVIYKKKNIQVKYKDVSEFLIPYEERPSTIEKRARQAAPEKAPEGTPEPASV